MYGIEQRWARFTEMHSHGHVQRAEVMSDQRANGFLFSFHHEDYLISDIIHPVPAEM